MQEMKKGSSKKELAIRIIKIVIFTLLLCGVICLSLKWYLESVSETVTYLEGEKRPNTVWVVKYGSVILPSITVALLLTVAYKIGHGYIAVKTQIDKAVITSFVCIFTYAYLFVEICNRSQGWMLPPAEDAEDVKSLLERSIIWFSVQALSFLIMISYHAMRAKNEKKELAQSILDESEVGEDGEV